VLRLILDKPSLIYCQLKRLYSE